MLRRALLVALLPLVLAACGGSRRAATTELSATAPATTASTAAAPVSVVAYFLRDGKVAPVRADAPATRAVATAALEALFAGPPEGYDTAIPAGGRLVSLAIENGVATATLSPELRELPTAAEAQIVYTLTRFPTVSGVALRLPDAPLPILDDNGEALDTYATRANFEHETPLLLVDSPLPGDAVTSPLRVTGTSNLYEATSQVELVRDGRTIAKQSVTASSGNGERGTFDVSLPFSGTGPAALVSYDNDAADGSIRDRVEIPVTLR